MRQQVEKAYYRQDHFEPISCSCAKVVEYCAPDGTIECAECASSTTKRGGHFNLGRLRSGAQSKDKRTLNKLRCVTVVYSEC